MGSSRGRELFSCPLTTYFTHIAHFLSVPRFNAEDRAKAGLTGEWYEGMSGKVWDEAMRTEEAGGGGTGLEKGVAALKV